MDAAPAGALPAGTGAASGAGALSAAYPHLADTLDNEKTIKSIKPLKKSLKGHLFRKMTASRLILRKTFS
jgi:hypothetical protein